MCQIQVDFLFRKIGMAQHVDEDLQAFVEVFLQRAQPGKTRVLTAAEADFAGHVFENFIQLVARVFGAAARAHDRRRRGIDARHVVRFVNVARADRHTEIDDRKLMVFQ